MTGVDQWATYADAARIVGVPEATLRWWVHRGRKGQGARIETLSIRGRVYVHLEDTRRTERDARHAREQS